MECNLCKKKIHVKTERYTHIEDWIKEKKTSEIWCHETCFAKAMNRQLSEMEKEAKQLLNMSKQLLGRLGIENPNEVYEVKNG